MVMALTINPTSSLDSALSLSQLMTFEASRKWFWSLVRAGMATHNHVMFELIVHGQPTSNRRRAQPRRASFFASPARVLVYSFVRLSFSFLYLY
jgi:hypothetical protein